MSYEVDILIVYADIVFIENLIINYELFLEYREEILIMRECLMLIKNLTKNEMTI